MMQCDKPVVRKGRKFDQVLEGAREIFMRDGFEGASVDDIAKAAEVSKATLYSYFPDKSFLFMEVAKCECCRQAERADSEIDHTHPPAEVLTYAGHRLLDFMISAMGEQMFRLCVAEARRFPELGQTFYETGPKMVASRLGAYLDAAVADGNLKIDDTYLAACQFAELCKADVWTKLVFGIQTEFTAAEKAHVVDSAVSTFLARYGA